jgi:hypothetical protein
MALATEWLVVVDTLVAVTLAEAVASDLNGAPAHTVSLQRLKTIERRSAFTRR